MNDPQNTQRPAYSPPAPPVRTLDDFRFRVAGITEETQLTVAGKDLARAYEWTFVGDSYRQA